MRPPVMNSGWNQIESAAPGNRRPRQALYAAMAMSANSDWLDQFEEGNTAGGHAGEVEAVPIPPARPR
jgi:hypothetical protein